jgi:ferredoxin
VRNERPVESAERWRTWDTCFSIDHSYIHGGSVRRSPRSRYRQWLTHKFGTWFDQFGTSGCVGCGRCITWCPVGIDVARADAICRRRGVERCTRSMIDRVVARLRGDAEEQFAPSPAARTSASTRRARLPRGDSDTSTSCRGQSALSCTPARRARDRDG